MGLSEWIAGFSLPKTEDECISLRTAETDAKPVQWNVTDEKCTFFVQTDEARLGMSNCTADQMFDMSNNTCGAQVVDSSCGAGMYRPSEGADCVDAPSSVFDQAALVSMGECGAMTSLADDGSTVTGTHSWSNDACSLSCNEGFTLNDAGDLCVPVEEEFTNRMRNLSDRDIMILLVLVALMYVYRKQLKQALQKVKI